MTNDLTFKTNSIFESVTYEKDTASWHFYFSDKIYASSFGFWRLLKANKIVFTSFDNGHQFGLPQPLDLVENITKQLTAKKLTEIRVNKDTADLTLVISDDIKIQIFIASSGYEAYDFSFGDNRYIGLGSGDIEIC
ncbi:hypothetical protein GCM10027275_35230 [Rhabdobacter roseus]|uniref:Uncharacterized protein n=1 Tax=Rhabdobacter roseus TaxID=1655419 RepID=A0A840TQR5_9BACT|nr:hypothetical protein [Rhabdobacter roseus]MBB5285255.1 hypothetical protein [Rhabdobacter roseus]